jgi:hypothetical protein
LRCDIDARRIFASVSGATSATITLRASTTLKNFPAVPTSGPPGFVTAEIAPGDAILDALAFSRGRFTVALESRAYTLPTWPEFSRVVEDCRR